MRRLLLLAAMLSGACTSTPDVGVSAEAVTLPGCNDVRDCPAVGACMMQNCTNHVCAATVNGACDCMSDTARCDDGDPCTTDTCVAGTTCGITPPAGGTCASCGNGERFCLALDHCVDNELCCQTTDCTGQTDTHSSGNFCGADNLCAFNCNNNRADCDRKRTNGCETHTDNDENNCGSCGNVCPMLTWCTSTCSGGVCSPCVDMAPLPDLAKPVDLRPPPDLAMPLDMAVPIGDLATSADLASLPDLTGADLSGQLSLTGGACEVASGRSGRFAWAWMLPLTLLLLAVRRRMD